MEYTFYFESKFRTIRDVSYLRFQVPDGTEFVLSEEWMVSNQRKRTTRMQRLIFLKRNNYGNIYRITVEVSSAANNASGKIILLRKTKPIRTSIIILITDFQQLHYPIQEKVRLDDVEICQRIIDDIFKYKVTIIRLDASEIETKTIPEPDKILIMPNQLHSLLETEDFSDVIITGECEIHGVCEIKAHRNILAARSVYFSCMFENQWIENRNNRIVINNQTDMILMKEVLHFIYSGMIRPMKISVMFDLYMVADMFLLDNLKVLLSKELEKHLCLENSVGIFILAYFTSDIQLHVNSLQVIRRNFDRVQNTEIWRYLQNNPRILHYDVIMEEIYQSIN